MSITATILQHSSFSLAPMVRLLAGFSAIAAVLVVFRPLLTGMVRAAILVVRPRLTLEERKARALMRDRRVLDRMIASSCGPSHAAELRAIAARD